MRDFALAIVVFGSIPFILVRPQVGILMWSWVSLMNPHRMTWGFMYDFPLALVIGTATIVAFVFSKEERKIPWDSISVLMLLYVLWTGVTTAFALVPDAALTQWEKFAKIILMTFMAIVMMRSEKRLDALVWVSVLSIGYFSIKGGVFTLATAGQYRVWGPPGSFIGDNNAMALATLMILPPMRYLASIAKNKWVRWAMTAGMVLSLVSVIGSYSRGALVGMVVVGAFWWWRSKHRVVVGALTAMALMLTVPLIPPKWFERMDTVQNYEEDASARGRIEMWVFATNVALDRPIIGGGFGVFTDPKLYDRYNPGIKVRNVHSIYFEALGTQGFVGLALFLMLAYAGFAAGNWVRRQTKDRPDLAKERQLATLLQVGILAFLAAGAFQNLSTFDLYYDLLAMMLLCKGVVQQKLAAEGESRRAGAGAVSFRRTGPVPRPAAALLPGAPRPAGAGAGFRQL